MRVGSHGNEVAWSLRGDVERYLGRWLRSLLDFESTI
jgi:hypothetical protein